MKKIIQVQTILLMAFFLSLPFALLSQEETKEKKVRVKTVKMVDGKKIVQDTTFYVSDEGDVKEVVKQFTVESEGDSIENIMVDVIVDVDSEIEWETNSGKNVFVIKKGHCDGETGTVKKIIVIEGDGADEHVMVYPHRGHRKVMKFKSGDGGDEEIIMVSPRGYHKTLKWKSDGDGEYEFDFEFDMENFHEEMAEFNDEMRNIRIMMIDEEGVLQEEMIEWEHLAELQELEHMKNTEVMVMPPRRPAPHAYRNFDWHQKGGMKVTDTELREAGIKNKQDRLELNEINIKNENGVIDLSFSLKEEGSPKVAVFNVYGDKVFSGKPVLMNNEYQIKMDLSKKQFGTYYLQIVLGNSSKTMRIKL